MAAPSCGGNAADRAVCDQIAAAARWAGLVGHTVNGGYASGGTKPQGVRQPVSQPKATQAPSESGTQADPGGNPNAYLCRSREIG